MMKRTNFARMKKQEQIKSKLYRNSTACNVPKNKKKGSTVKREQMSGFSKVRFYNFLLHSL